MFVLCYTILCIFILYLFLCRKTEKQYHVIGKNNQLDVVSHIVHFYIPKPEIHLKIQVCLNNPDLRILLISFMKNII